MYDGRVGLGLDMDMPKAPDENNFEGCEGWFVKNRTFAPLMITSSVALKNPLDASASGRVFFCFVVSLLLEMKMRYTTYWESVSVADVVSFWDGKTNDTFGFEDVLNYFASKIQAFVDCL